jgi:hypothetical protein
VSKAHHTASPFGIGARSQSFVGEQYISIRNPTTPTASPLLNRKTSSSQWYQNAVFQIEHTGDVDATQLTMKSLLQQQYLSPRLRHRTASNNTLNRKPLYTMSPLRRVRVWRAETILANILTEKPLRSLAWHPQGYRRDVPSHGLTMPANG